MLLNINLTFGINKITFEGVSGTKIYRYNRNLNIYRVEINLIYKFL